MDEDDSVSIPPVASSASSVVPTVASVVKPAVSAGSVRTDLALFITSISVRLDDQPAIALSIFVYLFALNVSDSVMSY
jgi:hypothetical protein